MQKGQTRGDLSFVQRGTYEKSQTHKMLTHISQTKVWITVP